MGWKIYSWVIGVIFVLAMITDPEIRSIFLETIDSPLVSPPNLMILIRKIFSLFLIIGTFCYAYGKSFLKQAFWKPVFFIAVADELWSLVEFSQEYEFGIIFIAGVIVGWGSLVPAFVALFRYGYRSETLWKATETVAAS